jgi:hypothetical protein
MLTLVHPARPGQDPPKRRHGSPAPSLALTDTEARNVRTVIRNVTPRHGAVTQLAARLGVNPKALSAARRPSPGLALALARELRLSLDAMLSGKLTRAGKCPACGAKAAGGAT